MGCMDCMRSRPQEEVGVPVVKQKIYTLYEPRVPGVQPEIDIVFFHGLQLGDYKKAYIHTWESDVPAAAGAAEPHRRICWPQEWLGNDFPNARILSISYDSRPFRGGRQHLRDIVKRILLDLITLAKVGQNRPVILVGHSLGGLVIKKMCVEANTLSDAPRSMGDIPSRAKEFLQNTLGAVFYATPHGGAPLARVVKWLDIFQTASPVLRHLATNHHQLTDLTDDFDDYRRKWNWTTYGFGEVLPIPYTGCLRIVVVPAAYVRRDKVDTYIPVDIADHFSICKPDSRTHPSYMWIRKFVDDSLRTESAADIDRPYRAVRGLSCPEKLEEALRYIRDIPCNNQEIAKQFLEAGVMPSLMKMLESDSTDRKKQGAWALDSLAYRSGLKQVKLEAGEAGAIGLLVHNMQTDKKTIFSGLFCLRVLTEEVENRKKLKSCGPEAENLLERLKDCSTTSDYVDDRDLQNQIQNAARTVLESMQDIADPTVVDAQLI